MTLEERIKQVENKMKKLERIEGIRNHYQEKALECLLQAARVKTFGKLLDKDLNAFVAVYPDQKELEQKNYIDQALRYMTSMLLAESEEL